MKFIDLECPKCGAGLTVTEKATKVKCDYCDREYILVPEKESLLLAEAEEPGYEYIDERQDAIHETEVNSFKEPKSEQLHGFKSDSLFRRMNRKLFAVCFIVLWVLCVMVFGFVSSTWGINNTGADIVMVLTLTISLFLVIRRLHDLNRSAWFAVFAFVPYVNIAVLGYLLFIKGTDGDNKFGADPLREII